MPAVPEPEWLPVWPVPRALAERQYFGAALRPLQPAAANALLGIEQMLSTRNTPAGGQFRVYVPAPGKFLSFPGTGNALWNNPAVPSPSSPNQPPCQQCPSGHRGREKLQGPVHTTSARLRSHPDLERHLPGGLTTRPRPSDLPVLGRLRDTPRIGSARGHGHPAI